MFTWQQEALEAGRGGVRARPLSSAASQRGAPARTSLRPWRPASPTRKAAPAAREPRAARAWGPGGGEVNWTPRRTQPGSGERSAVGDRRRGRAGGGALSPRAGSGERGPGRDLERRARSTGLEEAPGGGLSRVAFRDLPPPPPPAAAQVVGQVAALWSPGT